MMHSNEVVGLFCLVALTACGGGGSEGRSGGTAGADVGPMSGESPVDPPAGGAAVSGRVLDAVTGVAIQGVDVSLVRSAASDADAAGAPSAVTTGADGRYVFDAVPAADDYAAAFDVDGYKNETYAGIALEGAANAMLEPVRLVSDDNAGTGQLAGVVDGAIDGSDLSNLTLDFREGINRRSGEVIATARTATGGGWQVGGLGHGNVTAEIRGEGIRRSHATFQVLGNILTTGRAVTVSPAGSDAGPLRVVLTWDERPRDLDAHLTGPESGGQEYFHVFSGDRHAEGARLVADATTGSGPETVEIDSRRPEPYRYSVFNFSGDADRPLERSGARVEVLSGDASMAVFTVPTGVGDLWTVFDIEGGRIVPVDAVAPLRNVLDFFPPQGRELASASALARGAVLYGPRVVATPPARAAEARYALGSFPGISNH